jgi:hypothetical protein
MAVNRDIEAGAHEDDDARSTPTGCSQLFGNQVGNGPHEKGLEEIVSQHTDHCNGKSGRTVTDYEPASYQYPFQRILVFILLASTGLIELAMRTLATKEDDDQVLRRQFETRKRSETTDANPDLSASMSLIGDD